MNTQQSFNQYPTSPYGGSQSYGGIPNYGASQGYGAPPRQKNIVEQVKDLYDVIVKIADSLKGLNVRVADLEKGQKTNKVDPQDVSKEINNLLDRVSALESSLGNSKTNMAQVNNTTETKLENLSLRISNIETKNVGS